MRARRSGSRGGFTLIELLAVLLILSLLVTFLVTQIGSSEEAARVETTRRQLALLSAAIDHYESEFGDYPPSSFTDVAGVSNDGTNLGVEALVVALWSRDWNGGGLLPDVEERLANLDGDSAPGNLTDFGTRELLEIIDAWGNPIAYIHRRDYGLAGREYVTVGPVTGETITSAPRAYQNPVTKRFYRSTRYQLISAGPDGRFGTEDDITPFERSAP